MWLQSVSSRFNGESRGTSTGLESAQGFEPCVRRTQPDPEEGVVAVAHGEVESEPVPGPRDVPLQGRLNAVWEEQVHADGHGEPHEVRREEEVTKRHNLTHARSEPELRRLAGRPRRLGGVDPAVQAAKEAFLVDATDRSQPADEAAHV